jgi:excisionase family DNA binding protein
MSTTSNATDTRNPGSRSWLSPSQTAEEVRVHVKTVISWIRTGRLKASKCGPRLWRIDRADLEQFLRRDRPTT